MALLPGVCVAVALVAGCARPRGPLFTPLDPPMRWPGPPEPARIRYVGSLSGSDDLHAGRSGAEAFRAALRGPRPPIKFSGPHSVAIKPPGILAVADAAGACVHVIDLESRAHLRVSGWGEERFGVPLGVAWAGDRLFVSDAKRHEVIELDARGTFHGRFGADALRRPVGLTYVRARDQLYVVDGDAHEIAVFDRSGRRVNTIGRHGNGPGEFNYPSHISCAGQRLLIADSANFRVQLLDLDGRCLKAFGRKGNAAGDFALPKGVAFDGDGHLYVVDAQFENIQIFDDQGRLLLAFGEEGCGPGKFWLPAGLAIDEEDRIWVADAGNRRIQVFAYLRAES